MGPGRKGPAKNFNIICWEGTARNKTWNEFSTGSQTCSGTSSRTGSGSGPGTGSGTGSSKVPAQVLAQVPVHVPEQVPVQVPEQVPIQVPVQVPEQVSEQVPEQVPKASRRGFEGSDRFRNVPEQVPEQVPEHSEWGFRNSLKRGSGTLWAWFQNNLEQVLEQSARGSGTQQKEVAEELVGRPGTSWAGALQELVFSTPIEGACGRPKLLGELGGFSPSDPRLQFRRR